MPWWGWIIAGVVLLAAELLAIEAQFYLVLLGVAALLTGLGVVAGLPGQPYAEWALFAVLAIVLMFGVRRQLYGWLVGSPPPMYEAVVGEIATVSETIEPGALGRARLRGVDWTARNVGRTVLTEGQRARIERVENLVVDLQAEEA